MCHDQNSNTCLIRIINIRMVLYNVRNYCMNPLKCAETERRPGMISLSHLWKMESYAIEKLDLTESTSFLLLVSWEIFQHYAFSCAAPNYSIIISHIFHIHMVSPQCVFSGALWWSKPLFTPWRFFFCMNLFVDIQITKNNAYWR